MTDFIKNNPMTSIILAVISGIIIYLIFSLFLSFYKVPNNLTEEALKDVFPRKFYLKSGFLKEEDEKIALKYTKIAYKQLCGKELNEEEYFKNCLNNFNTNKEKTKSLCLNIILNKYMISDKILDENKKDLFAAYYLTLLKNRLPYDVFTENDYYDECQKILFIEDHDIPRKINDEVNFIFSDILIFRNETSIEQLKDDLYNIFEEIRKENNIDIDIMNFKICKN